MGFVIRQSEKVCCGLARRIRTRGIQRRVLPKRARRPEASIYLIRRDLHVPSYLVFSAFVEQAGRARYVRSNEGGRVQNGAIDVGLRGEIDDGIKCVFLEERLDLGLLGDISADKAVTRISGDLF